MGLGWARSAVREWAARGRPSVLGEALAWWAARAWAQGEEKKGWASWGIGLLSLLLYFFLFSLFETWFSLIQIQPRSTILDRCTSKQHLIQK